MAAYDVKQPLLPPPSYDTPPLPTDWQTDPSVVNHQRVNTVHDVGGRAMEQVPKVVATVAEGVHVAHDKAHNMHDRYELRSNRVEQPTTMGIFLLCLLACFLPPVPVFLRTGCSCPLLVNIVLWALGWIPGVIHSMYVIYSYPPVRTS